VVVVGGLVVVVVLVVVEVVVVAHDKEHLLDCQAYVLLPVRQQ
jgi:hypothetical protein